MRHKNITCWTFRIFLIFFCSGREGGVRGAGRGGGRLLIENPRRGVSRKGRGRGARRVSAANWEIARGGGGLNIFFVRGRNVHQDYLPEKFLPEFVLKLPLHDLRFFEFWRITRYLLYLCELRDIIFTRLGSLPWSNDFLLPLPDLKFSESIG